VADKEASLLLRIKTMGEEALSRTSDMLASMAKIGAAGFATLSAVVYKSISAYKEQEDAVRSLSQSMINNGIYSKELVDEYSAQASALQKLSTYGDEQIMMAQSQLQQQIGSTKITKELTQTILDFAAAQKMDLSSAAEVVGKSIGTTTNALGRYGIEVSATASKQEKMAAVIEGLNSKFGGQAAAAAEGLGSLEQLKVTVGDLFESLGERLAPIVTLVAKALNALAGDASIVTPVLDGMTTVIKNIIIASVYAYEGIRTLAEVITTGLATAAAVVGTAIEGNFKGIPDIINQAYTDIDQIATDRATSLGSKLSEIDKAFAAEKEVNIAEETSKLQQSLKNREGVLQKERDNAFVMEAERKSQQRANDLALADIQHQEDMARLITEESNKALALSQTDIAKTQALIAQKEKEFQVASSASAKRKVLEDKSRLEEQLAQQSAAKKEIEIQKIKDEALKADRLFTLNTLTTLARSSNKELAAIGKAAAVTEIAIQTPLAVSRAFGAFPPPLNFAAAGLVAAAMATQAAQVAGIQLADGGIVKARPGGIQATIGEGGQDEAVIPLDKAGSMGFGGGTTINVTINGGLLGDRSSAQELALALDKELYILRKNNQSTAFDRI